MNCVGNVRGCPVLVTDISRWLCSGQTDPRCAEPNNVSVKRYLRMAGHCCGEDAQGEIREETQEDAREETRGKVHPQSDCSPCKKLSGAKESSKKQKAGKRISWGLNPTSSASHCLNTTEHHMQQKQGQQRGGCLQSN